MVIYSGLYSQTHFCSSGFQRALNMRKFPRFYYHRPIPTHYHPLIVDIEIVEPFPLNRCNGNSLRVIKKIGLGFHWKFRVWYLFIFAYQLRRGHCKLWFVFMITSACRYELQVTCRNFDHFNNSAQCIFFCLFCFKRCSYWNPHLSAVFSDCQITDSFVVYSFIIN